MCQGYIIWVRRYRVKSSPLQVFCNQLVDKISVSKTLNILVAGFFFWVAEPQPGNLFLVVLFIVGKFWSVLYLVRSVEVFRGSCQALGPVCELWQVLMVGFELSYGDLLVFVCLSPSVVVVLVVGGGIDGFLGIVCHSSGPSMTVHCCSLLLFLHVGPSVWLAHVVL